MLLSFYKRNKGDNNMIGIYKITNNINGECYIGQSIHIKQRFAQHKSPYEQQRHSDLPLYRAILKYGIQNFTFEIIEECSVEELEEKEQYYISYFHSMVYEKGYNIKSGGEGNYGENHPSHKLTELDVIDIRTRYNNKERCKEVELLYRDKIGHSGFSKVWKGETWKHIMPEVYTEENKNFHLHNTGQKGSSNGRSKLTEADVIAIRLRKNNGENWKEVYEDYKYTGIKPNSFYQTWMGYNWTHIVTK